MEEKHVLGKKGEEFAQKYLDEHSYTILERNWRNNKAEIDIIAKKNNWMVFIEVKTRSSEAFGSPETFVSEKQQGLIISAAHQYIEKNDLDLEARFDIITLIPNENEFEINHIQDAFSPLL